MSVRSPPANPGYDTRISSPSTSPVRPPTKTTTSAARAASSASSKGALAPGSCHVRRTSASRMRFEVLEPQVVGLPLLEVDDGALGKGAGVAGPFVDHRFAVEEQPKAVVARDGQLVTTGDGGHELARPADGEVVVRQCAVRGELAARHEVAGGRPAVPAEVDRRDRRAESRGIPCEVASLEVLAPEAVLGRARGGPQGRGVDRTAGPAGPGGLPRGPRPGRRGPSCSGPTAFADPGERRSRAGTACRSSCRAAS